MKAAHVFVSGFVQGVGFRRFVQSRARRNNVKGWVKNVVDGRVEAVLFGQKEDIEKVVEDCNRGPFLSEVEKVDVWWKEIKENIPSDFKIIR